MNGLPLNGHSNSLRAIFVHSGPAKFNIDDDAKLSFVWDNTHSWLRAKTVHFALNYYTPNGGTVVDAKTGMPTI